MESITAQKPLKIMLIDDSATMRNVLRQELAKYDALSVVAQASNGKLALPRVRHYSPDVIILDQEMPELNGLETLQILRRDYPEIAVIMFASPTQESARITLKALDLGALDFIAKPNLGKDDFGAFVKTNFVDRLVQLLAKREKQVEAPVAPVTPTIHIPTRPGVFDICAIGISTGGPVALRKVLSNIQQPIQGSLLIVQHMPPVFTKSLAETLNMVTPINVVEGEHGTPIKENYAYVAPGGRHMEIGVEKGQRVIQISDAPPEANCRPSVNVLFRSVARTSPKSSVGIIMTGMGSDGFEGMKLMKQAGSYLIAQSRESCLIYGMPSLPTEKGLVEETQNEDGIASRISTLLGGRK